MIKLVAIDVDDTLFMTEEAVFAVENELAVSLGHEPMMREAHLKNWGRPLREAIAERIPGINVDEFIDLMKKRLPEFVKSGALDTMSPGTLATLKAIKDSGRKMAILTAREHFEAEHLLDPEHVLAGYIEEFYYRDNTDYLKPDPRVFAPILQKFNVLPEEAVYIGDSPNDGRCAKGARMHFIALMESGIRSKEDFKDVEVDYFAQTFTGILPYIEAN